MRALSIRQPYVELILRRLKREECRTWTTNHRGALLLHASRTITSEERTYADGLGMSLDNLPRGGIVGVADVVGCRKTRERYAWELAEVRRFREPIPYAGAVGIFFVDDALVAEAIGEAVSDPEPRKRGVLSRLFGRSFECP